MFASPARVERPIENVYYNKRILVDFTWWHKIYFKIKGTMLNINIFGISLLLAFTKSFGSIHVFLSSNGREF